VIAALVVLGVGDVAWAAHFISHHRLGLTAALATAAGWAWHRTRRSVVNTGQRVTGMPALADARIRRPDLYPERNTA
jgi:hypothetical protein